MLSCTRDVYSGFPDIRENMAAPIQDLYMFTTDTLACMHLWRHGERILCWRFHVVDNFFAIHTWTCDISRGLHWWGCNKHEKKMAANEMENGIAFVLLWLSIHIGKIPGHPVAMWTLGRLCHLGNLWVALNLVILWGALSALRWHSGTCPANSMMKVQQTKTEKMFSVSYNPNGQI